MVMAKKKNEPVDEIGDEKAKPVTLRLPEPLLLRLDSYRKSQRFPPSRQVVIEKLIESFLDSKIDRSVED